MTNDVTELLDKLFSAIDDWQEAKRELRERQSEYTGYSPSWALSSWIEREKVSKREVQIALDAYIDERIKNAAPSVPEATK